MKLKLITNLQVEECKKRINNSIDSRPFAILFSLNELVGRVGMEKFWLQKRKRFFKNSFNRIFYGNFHKYEKGTIIEGCFKIHLLVRIFIVIWFAGIIAMAGISIVISFLDIIQEDKMIVEGNLILVLLVAMIMILFGTFFIRFGLRLSKKEEEYIIEFLQEALNVKEID